MMDRQALYELLAKIPRGTVATYGELAEALGNKKWARAVGNALHVNPDGDKYPCYRVVSSKGYLSTSYAFGGLEGQKRRLREDGVNVDGDRVDLEIYGFKFT